ncbi:ABC transporter ATP-binding protein [Agrobacterium tumefaciens]|uniref:ABC transporter ATP-binding protein n=1 Tax=Agrobacterium tumefaciens TaxID=358 RepID=UPI001F34C82B|nr:ABC transporter ATP-binding protein [Agrobacterium tumefaciens]WCK69445.1 ABC transporter ATP-binding protein [Agrobacterium tumefaciens]
MPQPDNITPPKAGVADGQSLPISISDITKTYGPVAALNKVSLDIKSGEFMTLLGPSGSGKTTLLMALAGFIRPDHGSIKFGEEEIVLKPPHRRDIGMMFQSYALFPHMNVFANIAYPLKIRGRSKSEIKTAVDEVLETVQLQGYGSRNIAALSGGQRQRIALARAVVSKPKILLMDEPLSALDKNLRELMQVELRAMHERLGMTTVLVTHDQREALTMSDRVAVLRGGEISQIDTPERIYNAPKSAFVAAFMGESSFLPVGVTDSTHTYAGRALKIASSTAVGKAGLLVIRPEKLEIVSSPEQHHASNHFDGTLERILFQGDSCLIFVRLKDGILITIRRHLTQAGYANLPEVGAKITVALPESETIIVANDEEAVA